MLHKICTGKRNKLTKNLKRFPNTECTIKHIYSQLHQERGAKNKQTKNAKNEKIERVTQKRSKGWNKLGRFGR